MRINKLSRWSMVLASLAFTLTNARVPGFAEPAETSEAPLASWAGQNGSETGSQPNTPTAKRVVDDYLIGPSDILAINVWKDTELTRTVTVRPDGKISLPLVGELAVSGLTALSVQRLIVQRLKEYISNPQVAVIVQEVKSQTYVIVGKVAKPGSYPLEKPTTVLEAIAVAGGLLDFAKASKINIIRRTEARTSVTLHFDYKKATKGKNLAQNVELKNGDTVVVP